MALTFDPVSLLDGRVSDAKLDELLAFQAELSVLDYKSRIDLNSKAALLAFVKDVGAMSAAGGYLVGGVDGHGVPTGDMDDCSEAEFDEARLVPKLARYLPEPITITTRFARRDGHVVVLILVGAHPNGYAIFHTDGQHQDGLAKPTTVFRQGEAYWRDGTRSTRITQVGMEAIIQRRIQAAKTEWVEEQRSINAVQREEWRARDAARTPLASLSINLASRELQIAALELVRANDDIALQHLTLDAQKRARAAIEADDDAGIGAVADKLAVIGTVMQQYEQHGDVHRTIRSMAQLYSLPLETADDRVFGMSTRIDPGEIAPRVFLQIIQRVYAMGALAVRLERWADVRTLTLQLPAGVDDYYNSWLRHALTTAARAGLLEMVSDGQRHDTSLLSMAAAVIAHEPALKPDGVGDELILTSLAQFDLLANLVAVDDADSADTRYFYTNWARFRQGRIQPVADRVLADGPLRRNVFRDRDDRSVAGVLAAVGAAARPEAFRFDGFRGWDSTPVGQFIQAVGAEPLT